MNFKTIGIVISREYLNKVKKKSFIWTTLLVPILVAGLTIGVMVALMNTKEKTKNIAVVDASGIVLPYLEDTETIHYTDLSSTPIDSVTGLPPSITIFRASFSTEKREETIF